MEPVKSDRKILFLDIENVAYPENIFNTYGKYRTGAGFFPDKGYILVFGYKWLGDDEARSVIRSKKSFKIDPESESKLCVGDDEILEEIHSIINQADIVVTYYGKGHDMPFINGRLLRKGLYLNPNIKHIDLYRTVKSAMRLSSHRLDNVAAFLGTDRKEKVSYALWPRTWAGDYDALLDMAHYCRGDVTALEGPFNALLPFMKDLPTMNVRTKFNLTSCPKCSSTNTTKAGFWVAANKTHQAYRCKNCSSTVKGEVIDREALTTN